MNLSPWIRIFIMFQIFVMILGRKNKLQAVVRHPRQFVVESVGFTGTIMLDGSLSTHAESYSWSTNPSYGIEFTTPTEKKTNATFTRSSFGKYKFKLEVTNKGKTRHTFAHVVVEDPGKVGMYVLATSVTTQLLKMQYQYLFLSYHYLRSDNYFPKVAEYFRSFSFDCGSMLDKVMDYVTDKQATVDMLGSFPPDYVTALMKHGLPKKVIVTGDVTNVMASSFKVAIHSEKDLAKDLSLVTHYAEMNEDHELAHVAAADLLPQVMKVVNEHSNHFMTVLKDAEESPQRHLVEYLFDKNLKRST